MKFWKVVAADAKAVGRHIDSRSFMRHWEAYKLRRVFPGFACVFWLRVNQLLAQRNSRGSFRLRIWRQYRFHCGISEYAKIGPGFFLPHPINIHVGSDAVIGENVTLYDGVTLGDKREGEEPQFPTLGDNVIVYTGAKIIGKVTIGDNVEIGALSLCLKDVPSNSVMYGIPPNVTVRPK